jgi:selenocysteine lyase/cysteine desulfurase
LAPSRRSAADAVHYAAHEPIDVTALGVDVLLCSPYKFCGPHLGLAFGRAELMETWRPYKTRVWTSTPVGRSLETGTAPYELLAGFEATVDYLDSFGGMESIRQYERALGERMLDGFLSDERVTVYGVQTMESRVPTFLVNVEGVPAGAVEERLSAKGIGVWARTTFSSVGLHERLGWGEAVRVGIAHYNTQDEVDRLLTALAELD